MAWFYLFLGQVPLCFLRTLTVLLTFFLGKKLFASRAGFLSGLILATSVEFAYIATRANIDATLTFFTTAALFCFFHGTSGRKKTKKRRRISEGIRFMDST